MDISFAIRLLIALPIAIGLHELGHYVPAKLFGWNPKFYFRKNGDVCGVSWFVERKGNEHKLRFTGFLGIIGIFPFLLLLSAYRSLPEAGLLAVIILLFVAYSIYELLPKSE